MTKSLSLFAGIAPASFAQDGKPTLNAEKLASGMRLASTATQGQS